MVGRNDERKGNIADERLSSAPDEHVDFVFSADDQHLPLSLEQRRR